MSNAIPAAGNEELSNGIDKLREKFEIALVNCGVNADNVDYDNLAAHRAEFRQDFLRLITAQNNAIYEAVMEAIGKDEPTNKWKVIKPKNAPQYTDVRQQRDAWLRNQPLSLQERSR